MATKKATKKTVKKTVSKTNKPNTGNTKNATLKNGDQVTLNELEMSENFIFPNDKKKIQWRPLGIAGNQDEILCTNGTNFQRFASTTKVIPQ